MWSRAGTMLMRCRCADTAGIVYSRVSVTHLHISLRAPAPLRTGYWWEAPFIWLDPTTNDVPAFNRLFGQLHRVLRRLRPSLPPVNLTINVHADKTVQPSGKQPVNLAIKTLAGLNSIVHPVRHIYRAADTVQGSLRILSPALTHPLDLLPKLFADKSLNSSNRVENFFDYSVLTAVSKTRVMKFTRRLQSLLKTFSARDFSAGGIHFRVSSLRDLVTRHFFRNDSIRRAFFTRSLFSRDLSALYVSALYKYRDISTRSDIFSKQFPFESMFARIFTRSLQQKVSGLRKLTEGMAVARNKFASKDRKLTQQVVAALKDDNTGFGSRAREHTLAGDSGTKIPARANSIPQSSGYRDGSATITYKQNTQSSQQDISKQIRKVEEKLRIHLVKQLTEERQQKTIRSLAVEAIFSPPSYQKLSARLFKDIGKQLTIERYRKGYV